MMIISKRGLIALTFILLVGVVSALSVQKTEFVFATDPYANLSISVINPDTNEELELFEGRARKFGEYRFTYYGTITKVNIIAKIVNNETQEVLKKEEFGPFTLGTPTINLNLSLGKVEEELEPSSELTNESASENSAISGNAVSEGFNLNISRNYYYIAAAILGLAVVVIVLRKHMSFTKSGPVEPNPKKLKAKTAMERPVKTEVQVQKVQQKSNDESINDTEKRIADLQKQLEQIRSEEKLAKLQKQLNLEKQSLKKLQDETQEPKVDAQQNNNLDNQNKPF